MKAVDTAVARAALERIAGFGGYSVVHAVPSTSADGWRPTADLYADADGSLGALVEETRRRLGTSERRVAASILHQGHAARLWTITVGCVLTTGVLPALPPADLLWRSTPTSLVELGLATWHGWSVGAVAPGAVSPDVTEQIHRTVVDGHLRALERGLGELVSLSPQVLAGNTASALFGTLRVIPAGATPAAAELARALVDRPGLREAGRIGTGSRPPSYQRANCCLYYRVPGAGTCGDCVLRHPPTPTRRIQRHADS